MLLATRHMHPCRPLPPHVASSVRRVFLYHNSPHHSRQPSLSSPQQHRRPNRRSLSTAKPPPQPAQTTTTTVDVLIVGAGAAGLLAALRCHAHGLAPLVVEKGPKMGGTAAYSGGGVWVPCNHLLQQHSPNITSDTPARALQYLDAVIGPPESSGPASSAARRAAFVANAPLMARWLAEEQGFRWVPTRGYPDYHPELPGAFPRGGRGIEPAMFDLKTLGPAWRPLLNENPATAGAMPPVYSWETPRLARMAASAADAAFAARVAGRWAWERWVRGREAVTGGRSLVGQLMAALERRTAEVWVEAGLEGLVVGEGGGVVGAVVKRKDGERVRVRARHGVVLAAGGFARNAEMRRAYHAQPIGTEWTSVPENDTGDAIRAGVEVGAATALMDEAWWGPTMLAPGLGPYFAMWDRSLPFSVVVDAAGRRFMNEAQPYVNAVHCQYARHRSGVSAIPAWLILDENFRRRYLLAAILPPFAKPTPEMLDSGFLVKADSVEDLACQTGVDAAGLRETLVRFNDMAKKGADEDFGRGASAFDRFFGDPNVKPNPNLGPITRPPFYAVKLYPGDLGTKGGLLTDEHARVVDRQGKPIPGLYASGNTTASVMGRNYPGPGSTLGPALTFSYIAVDHVARGLL